MQLLVLQERLAVCRLPAGSALPGWVSGDGFRSVTATVEELSIICSEARVPTGVRREPGWRALKLAGPFEFDAVGVLLPIAARLAQAGISILPVATFDTDYVLVKEARLAEARAALAADGHELRDA